LLGKKALQKYSVTIKQGVTDVQNEDNNSSANKQHIAARA
jgi:hypothetical protein